MNKSPICPKCGSPMEFYAKTSKGHIMVRYFKCTYCGSRFKRLSKRIELKLQEVRKFTRKISD